MQLVQQQDDFTCGIACAAMVAGVTFEEAFAKAQPFFSARGTGSRDMSRLLRSLGVRFTRKTFPELCRTVPHIVVAPSLNVVGGLHYIVVDLTNAVVEVYDPQRGRPGKQYYRHRFDDQEGFGLPLTAYAEVIRIDGVRKAELCSEK